MLFRRIVVWFLLVFLGVSGLVLGQTLDPLVPKDKQYPYNQMVRSKMYIVMAGAFGTV